MNTAAEPLPVPCRSEAFAEDLDPVPALVVVPAPARLPKPRRSAERRSSGQSAAAWSWWPAAVRAGAVP